MPPARRQHLAPSLDTLGLMTRDLADFSLVSDVLSAEPVAPPPERAAPPRFVLFIPSGLDRAEAAAISVLHGVAKNCGTACARRIEAPVEIIDLHAAHRTIMAAEVARAFTAECREHHALLCPTLADFIAHGLATDEASLAAAWGALARGRRWLAREIAGDEILITLPAAGEATLGLQSTGDASFNRIWTLLHAACVQVPAGRGPHGMPLGVQLIDVRGEQKELLAAASWLVRELDLAPPRPVAG